MDIEIVLQKEMLPFVIMFITILVMSIKKFKNNIPSLFITVIMTVILFLSQDSLWWLLAYPIVIEFSFQDSTGEKSITIATLFIAVVMVLGQSFLNWIGFNVEIPLWLYALEGALGAFFYII